jgi:hypothetical protein
MKKTKLPITVPLLMLLAAATSVSATVLYVDLTSASPAPPYTNWLTAATNIQDAIDVATAADEIVVTNGIYATGGRAVYGTMTNRVAVDKPLTVRSVNGPQFTVVQGYQVPGTTNGDGAMRCVYLTNGASLIGFTLTNGATRSSGDYWREQGGGGVFCESEAAMVSGCVIAGNAAFQSGGGAYSASLSNCTLAANSALAPYSYSSGAAGGGAFLGTLNHCTLSNNSAAWAGGGAAGATLNHCILAHNWAESGGGAAGGGVALPPCTLNHCTLLDNRATDYGGGAYGELYGGPCTLNSCALTGNSARFGGGAMTADLNNCVLRANLADYGGGARSCNLNSCTLTDNSASNAGGGVCGPSTLNNCILYYNSRDDVNYSYGFPTLNFCWTAYDPIGLPNPEPLFVDRLNGNLRLQSNSPCLNAGSNGCVVGSADLDGNPRIEGGTVDIGAYEFQPPAGVRYVDGSNPLPAAPYTSWATAAVAIQDAVDVAAAGDEIVVTNGVYATGGRAVFGTMTNRVAVDKPVTVRSVNGAEVTIIQGAKAPGPVGTGPAAVRCAYLTNGAALYGFTLTNGATHAGGDAARERCGGGIWCASVTAIVSNCIVTSNTASYYGGGVYSGTLNACTIWRNSALSGGGACYGALYNCMLNSNSVSSYGGGAFSNVLVNCTLKGNSARYYGGGAYLGTLDNCLLLTNSVSDSYDGNGGGAYSNILNGCTLRGNSAAHDGGGVYGGRVTYCMFIANSATYGGGASWSVLTNCTLSTNRASSWGGGVVSSTLKGCVLTGNSAPSGGGASDSTLVNCTVTGNSPEGCRFSSLTNCIVYFNAGNWGTATLMFYCCTTPRPVGVGNITNAPLFVDYAGGNLRLQSNSPCINAGRNTYAPGATELDGNPRIVSGTVDIGAYEFQGLGSAISYAWLQQYGLPTDGSADSLDSDADGRNNWQEWRCLTDPTNALSALRLLTPSREGTNVTLSWQGVGGVSYFLESSTNLTASPSFGLLATNLMTNQSGLLIYNDTNTADVPSHFYRLGVGP